MHRLKFLLIALLVSLGLVACSGAEPTIAPTEAPTVAPTETAIIAGPRTGEAAPGFTLPDSNGNIVRLADELRDNRFVVLVFFHSHQ